MLALSGWFSASRGKGMVQSRQRYGYGQRVELLVISESGCLGQFRELLEGQNFASLFVVGNQLPDSIWDRLTSLFLGVIADINRFDIG